MGEDGTHRIDLHVHGWVSHDSALDMANIVYIFLIIFKNTGYFEYGYM